MSHVIFSNYGKSETVVFSWLFNVKTLVLLSNVIWETVLWAWTRTHAFQAEVEGAKPQDHRALQNDTRADIVYIGAAAQQW